MTADAIKFAAEVEALCRQAYDEHFHKVAADIAYDQWRIAFKAGFRGGRADATKDWADHMTRVAAV